MYKRQIIYTARLANISLGVCAKICLIEGDAKSLELGEYNSQDELITTNAMDVATPRCTALCASFFPYISLAISVTKKVVAKRTFPSVISMPNAFTSIRTSMLAVIVASTVPVSYTHLKLIPQLDEELIALIPVETAP